MRLFNQKVWSGTATNTEVFTDAELSALLGSADVWAIHACITRAATSSTIKVNIYHSGDNKNWIQVGTSLVSGSLTAGGISNQVLSAEALSSTTARLGFVRLGILTNASPNEADVELYVTGRSI